MALPPGQKPICPDIIMKCWQGKAVSCKSVAMVRALNRIVHAACLVVLAAFLQFPAAGELSAQLSGEEVERAPLPELQVAPEPQTEPVLEPAPMAAPEGAASEQPASGTASETKTAGDGNRDRDNAAPAPHTARPADTADDAGPQVWRPNPNLARGDLEGREPIKIFVGNDYPPFNYTDAEGNLTGYNVDLARAICLVLRVRCTITAVAWDELVPGLLNGSADALMAGMKITARALEDVDFTQPYFRTPARFAVRMDDDIGMADGASLEGKRIGVVRGTAHAAFLADFFPRSVIRLYGSDTEAMDALRNGDVDATFGDGAALMFWTLSPASRDCCRLAPGAYLEPRYFGTGSGIAVRRGDVPLRNSLQFALDRLLANGTYDALTRRYFPARIY